MHDLHKFGKRLNFVRLWFCHRPDDRTTGPVQGVWPVGERVRITQAMSPHKDAEQLLIHVHGLLKLTHSTPRVLLSVTIHLW